MLKIEHIDYSRIEELLEILREKSRRLEQMGQPMWNPAFLKKEAFIEKYNSPDCFLAYEGEKAAGGFVLMEQDDFLWKENSADKAFYVHKLAVREGFSGKGYAHQMVEWIKEYSRLCNKHYVRLDCYEDRPYLMKLYGECGFTGKAVSTMPDGIRIAKFEYAVT